MRLKMRTTAVRLLLGAALASAVLGVAACNHSATRSDAQITSDIQAKVSGDSALANRQIAVQAADGVATLSGTVTSEAERRVAAEDAASVAGVRTVVNNLTVAAAPPEAQTAAETAPAEAAPAQPSAEERAAAHRREVETRRRELAAKRASERAARLRQQREEAAARARRQREQAEARATAPVSYREPVRQQAAAAPPPVYSQPAPAQNTYAQSSPAQPAYEQQPAPAAAPPPPPAPAFVNVPAGTPITIRLLDPLDSGTASPGETFRATLSQPVWMNGNIVIPSEAEALGRVTAARSAGRMSGAAILSIELMSVSYNRHTYVIHTDEWSREIQGRGKGTAEKMGGGAALGAIVGALAGGGKGAGIGALVGAGAGGTAQAVTHAKQVVLDTEARISFRLAQSVRVRPSAVNQRNAGRQPLD